MARSVLVAEGARGAHLAVAERFAACHDGSRSRTAPSRLCTRIALLLPVWIRRVRLPSVRRSMKWRTPPGGGRGTCRACGPGPQGNGSGPMRSLRCLRGGSCCRGPATDTGGGRTGRLDRRATTRPFPRWPVPARRRPSPANSPANASRWALSPTDRARTEHRRSRLPRSHIYSATHLRRSSRQLNPWRPESGT